MAWINYPEKWYAWIPNISGKIDVALHNEYASKIEPFEVSSDIEKDQNDGRVEVVWDNQYRLKINYCDLYIKEKGVFRLKITSWLSSGLYSFIIQYNDELTLNYDEYVEQFSLMEITDPVEEANNRVEKNKENAAIVIHHSIKNFYHIHTHHHKSHDSILIPIIADDENDALEKIKSVYLRKATNHLSELSKFMHAGAIKRFIKSIFSTNWAQTIVFRGIGEMAYAKSLFHDEKNTWNKFVGVYKNISNYINSTYTVYNTWIMVIIAFICMVFTGFSVYNTVKPGTKSVEKIQQLLEQIVP